MKLSIIGTGYVGLVTGVCFAQKGHDVLNIDNDVEKIELLRSGRTPIYEPGLDELIARVTAAGRLRFATQIEDAVEFAPVIFIAVGTPPLPSGEPDLSHLETVSRGLAQHLTSYRLIVEKSTVPVRTGLRVEQTIRKYVGPDVQFDVASNPEFLREGAALHDSLHPDRIVLGTTSERARQLLDEVYRAFPGERIWTDVESAELIKHASNSFLATKISFINAVANICEASGGNIDEVARGMGLDPRIGSLFLRAGLGYGGSCFPKDVDAFAALARALGIPFGLLEEVQKINSAQRHRFYHKVRDELWVVKGKTVAVLGLSFKPDTDDIRDAPALEIASWLLAEGAVVRAYDPKAMDKAAAQLPELVLCRDPYEAAQGADALILATEWKEFASLDWARIRRSMTHPAFFDGRNFLDPEQLRALGFVYKGVGRKDVP